MDKMGGSKPSTIIVVDDDASMRQGLRRLLRSAGFEVECFASAEELLAAVPLNQAACLVPDVRRPGMSGLDLHERLGGSEGPPTLFITGLENECDRERTRGTRRRLRLPHQRPHLGGVRL